MKKKSNELTFIYPLNSCEEPKAVGTSAGI